ncbi:MAG: hypothetical protein RBR59_07810 [Sulfurimonadaceae bacterium]|nr:hypothetical protein [Sulfurimonadaceae bacterium]
MIKKVMHPNLFRLGFFMALLGTVGIFIAILFCRSLNPSKLFL